jgi:hypothetical protein
MKKLGHISTFCKFLIHMFSKSGTFSDIWQKVKLIVLPIAITLRLNPIEIPKKYKIEAPYCRIDICSVVSFLIRVTYCITRCTVSFSCPGTSGAS